MTYAVREPSQAQRILSYDYLTAGERKALEAIYEEFRKRGDAPECLREYLYEKLGRCLP
jgi:hypothetical protein